MISKITKLCLLALLPAALVLPQPVFAEVTITDLGTLGGSYSEARGINGLGQVAGYSYTAWGNYHAFLWTAAGGIVDLGTMGGSHSAAINVLQAFINQVNSFIGSGVLASAQGQPLIDAANALIVQLSG